MAVDSWGYGSPKGVIPGLAAARFHAFIGGQRYWVEDPASVKVTSVGGGSRQVSIAPGYFGGYGILDRNPAAELLTLPVVPSGTAYSMICAKRVWASQLTSFDYVQGGSATVLPPRPYLLPSGTDYQPLFLCSMTSAGNPAIVADLRLIGGEHATSDLVRQFADWAGATITVGGVTWKRGLDQTGALIWIRDTPEAPSSDATFPRAAANVGATAVVLDRISVAAAPYSRRAEMVSNVYTGGLTAAAKANWILYAGGTAIGYARKQLATTDVLMASGEFTIPANTAVVFEARISRYDGTGTFDTSISSNLTNTNLTITRG